MRATLKYIALSFIPFSILIALMYYYASGIPYADEWVIAHLLEKFHTGTLTLSDIFAHHNEHRIVTGRLIMLMNAVLAGWNIYLELAVNVLLAVCSSIIIYYAVSRLEISSSKKMVLYFTCACMIFSFSQQHCMMWGFQMQILFSVFFNLLAIAFLAYGEKLSMPVALVSGLLATYSFANGMLVWPAGLVVLMMRGKKIPYGKIILWLAFAAACIACYFWGYESSMTAEKVTLTEKLISLLLHPHLFILLLATYLGAPLANYRQSLALFFGIIVIAVNVWYFFRLLRDKTRDNNSAFWFGADMYILLSAALTAYGRQGTPSTSMALRYMSLQIVAWVVTPCLFFMTLEKTRKIPLKIYIFAAVLIISHSVSEDALVRARERYDGLNLVSRQLKAGIVDTDSLRRYTGAGSKEIEMLPKLKSWGVKFLQNVPDSLELDDFRRIDLDAAELHKRADTSSAVDEIVITDGKFLNVGGWWQVDKFSERDRMHSLTFLILYNDDGAYEAVLDKWHGVPSIRAVRDSNIFDRYKKYRFGGNLFCGSLQGGKYNVALRVQSYDGDTYYFPSGQVVAIAEKNNPLL